MDEPQIEMTCDELDKKIAGIKLRIALEKRKNDQLFQSQTKKSNQHFSSPEIET